MRKLIVYTLAVFSVFVVFGQNTSDSTRVYFEINQGKLNPALNDNKASMDRFIDKMRRAADSDRLDHIVVYGYASPDGPFSVNERLALKRSEAFSAYIIERTGLEQDAVRAEPQGIAWDELRHLVADNHNTPDRERILEILDSALLRKIEGGGNSSLCNRLKSLSGGIPYRWMLIHLFPRLRHALAVPYYFEPVPDDFMSERHAADSLRTSDGAESGSGIAANASEQTVPGDELPGTASAASAMSAQDTGSAAPHHRFALKTNTLYYAALLPNLELEWLFNDHWSVSIEGNVAHWTNKTQDRCYCLTMIDSEVRRWIKPRAPWHGLFVGAFVGGGWYDLENGGPGYYGEGLLTGISLGYMWPISRNFSLEASAGAGYLYTRFKEYIPYEGHFVVQRTKELNYFGPLKLKLSIVWRFSDKNRTKRTGSSHEQ